MNLLPGKNLFMVILTDINSFLSDFRISQAVYGVIADGKVRTKDMGGSSSTTDFTNAILRKMEVV